MMKIELNQSIYLTLSLMFFCLVAPVSGQDEGVCTLCLEDHYCDNENITPCPANSRSDVGKEFITDCTCKPAYFGPNGGTCAECAVNTYCLGGISSVNCADNSESPAASMSPLSCTCKTGWYGDQGGPCTECEAGSWCSDGVKNSCPAFTSSPVGSNEITDCTCTPGYTGVDGTACTACIAGTYKVASGSAVCTVCGANTYSTDIAAVLAGVCSSCPANTFSFIASNELTDCTCVAGYQGEDGTACTSCIAGTYKPETGNVACTPCGVDSYSTTLNAVASSTCLTCPTNTLSGIGSDIKTDCICLAGHFGIDGLECTPCTDGTYKENTGDSVCISCLPDFYSTTFAAIVQETCLACPFASTSDAQSNAITDCTCLPGYYGENGGECIFCEVDSWCYGGAKMACVSNSISDQGSSRITDCVCMPGYNGIDGTSICQLCTADDYCPGGVTVNECPLDSGSEQGSSLETDCICDGGYEGIPGGPCEICVEGSYCSGGVMDYCPVHSTSLIGSDQLADCKCKPGHVGEDGGVCLECSPGSFCPGGNQEGLCPINSVTRQGSNSTADCICIPGWHGGRGDECFECEIGTWCSGGFQNQCPGFSNTAYNRAIELLDCICPGGYIGINGSACTPCESGTYKEYTGPGSCTACGVDKYSNTIAAAFAELCLDCPINTFSLEKSTILVDCKCLRGHSGADGFECTACPAGTYKIESGAGVCTACAENQFSTVTAATENTCQNCWEFSSSSEGSDAMSDCSCNTGFYNSVANPNPFR